MAALYKQKKPILVDQIESSRRQVEGQVNWSSSQQSKRDKRSSEPVCGYYP